MTTHPSDDQLVQFATRALAPADLLATDDHLATCDPCRRRAFALRDGSRHLEIIGERLLGAEGHLGEDEAEGYVDDRLTAPERARVEAHLQRCDVCAREVAELRDWVSPRPRARWTSYLAAAAVLLTAVSVGLAFWLLAGRRVPQPAGLAGLDALPADQREAIRAALVAGVAEPSPLLAELAAPSETLMGSPNARSFLPLTPLATVVIPDRPVFQWEPLAGARQYRVEVFDSALRPVVLGPATAATTWTPDSGLPRGQTYVWQVKAERADETVTSPAPPAPPARFAIADERTAAALGQVARDHPDSHLLLGLLYARAGARLDAESHLARVAADDPQRRVAEATRERLRLVSRAGGAR